MQDQLEIPDELISAFLKDRKKERSSWLNGFSTM